MAVAPTTEAARRRHRRRILALIVVLLLAFVLLWRPVESWFKEREFTAAAESYLEALATLDADLVVSLTAQDAMSSDVRDEVDARLRTATHGLEVTDLNVTVDSPSSATAHVTYNVYEAQGHGSFQLERMADERIRVTAPLLVHANVRSPVLHNFNVGLDADDVVWPKIAWDHMETDQVFVSLEVVAYPGNYPVTRPESSLIQHEANEVMLAADGGTIELALPDGYSGDFPPALAEHYLDQFNDCLEAGNYVRANGCPFEHLVNTGDSLEVITPPEATLGKDGLAHISPPVVDHTHAAPSGDTVTDRWDFFTETTCAFRIAGDDILFHEDCAVS